LKAILKPVEYECIIWDGKNFGELFDFVDGKIEYSGSLHVGATTKAKTMVETYEGVKAIQIGYAILKRNGKITVVHSDDLKTEYELKD